MSRRANKVIEGRVGTCAHCGKSFTTLSPRQKFCCHYCADTHGRKARVANAKKTPKHGAKDSPRTAMMRRLAARDAAYAAAFPKSGPVRFSWRAKAGCDVDADMIRRWA